MKTDHHNTQFKQWIEFANHCNNINKSFIKLLLQIYQMATIQNIRRSLSTHITKLAQLGSRGAKHSKFIYKLMKSFDRIIKTPFYSSLRNFIVTY